MSALDILLILVAGMWAGGINTIIGSGTLVTFPVLVSLGVPPVTATISNAMGLIAGNLTGAWGYRSKLAGVEKTLLKLLPCSLAGGVLGAWLLLHLPESVFESIAPLLVGVALIFVILQPQLQGFIRSLREPAAGASSTAGASAASSGTAGEIPDAASEPRQPLALYLLVFFAGVYGGYFVAAQGVLLLGILGVFLMASLQAANAVKTVLVAAVNLIAAASYLLFAFDRIDWLVVLLIAVSSTVGAWFGAKVGMRLKPQVLRAVICVLGVVAIINMVWF